MILAYISIGLWLGLLSSGDGFWGQTVQAMEQGTGKEWNPCLKIVPSPFVAAPSEEEQAIKFSPSSSWEAEQEGAGIGWTTSERLAILQRQPSVSPPLLPQDASPLLTVKEQERPYLPLPQEPPYPPAEILRSPLPPRPSEQPTQRLEESQPLLPRCPQQSTLCSDNQFASLMKTLCCLCCVMGTSILEYCFQFFETSE